MAVLGCLCLGVGLEFVQGEGKGGEKLRQEIVQLRQVEGVQGRAGLLGGGLELPVAAFSSSRHLRWAESLSAAFTKTSTSGSDSSSRVAKAGRISWGSMATSRWAASASTAL